MKNFTVNAKTQSAKAFRSILLVIFFSLSVASSLALMHLVAGYFGIDMTGAASSMGFKDLAVGFLGIFIILPASLMLSIFILEKIYRLLRI